MLAHGVAHAPPTKRTTPVTDLFAPTSFGSLDLSNRIVMAPLTRMRSGSEGVPGDIVVEHYAQRASVGLIVSEGTYPSHEGQGFIGQPGLVTAEQLAGWRRVTDAVHAAGGPAPVGVPGTRSASGCPASCFPAS